MAGGTVPNKKLPFLREIPTDGKNWRGIRAFLEDIRQRVESIVQNPDPPDPVRGFTLEVRPAGLHLTWKPANLATSYVIYRAFDSIQFSDAIAITVLSRADNVSYFDPAGQSSTAVRRTYWIQARNGVVEGPISAAITTTEPLIQPEAVEGGGTGGGFLKNTTRQRQVSPRGALTAAAAPTSTDTGADTVTFAVAKNWPTGTRVTVNATAGGLTAATEYYLHKTSTTVFSFHTTCEDAYAGTSLVNLTASITATVTPDAVVAFTIASLAAPSALASLRNEGTAGNWLIRFGGVAPTTTVYSVKLGPGDTVLGTLGEAYTEENPPTGDVCVYHDDDANGSAGVLGAYGAWSDGTSPLAGATGPQGTAGATGATGGAGFRFLFNSATSGDPTSGMFLFNNATFASATQLNISETDADANAMAAFFAAIDNSTSTNKVLVTAIKQGGAAFFSFYITAALTDAGSYDTYPITPVTTSGSITSADVFFLSFSIVGDKGDTGATGAAGTPFTLTLNESGASLSNWTQAVGSWTVVSSEFEVTTPATTVDRLRYTNPIAQSAIVYEGQFKMFSGSGHGADNRMGLEFNVSGTSTTGCLVTLRATGTLNPSSTGIIYTEEPAGLTAGPSFTFHFNLDQFYTIRAVAIGNVMDIYIDGTYQCTHARQPINGVTEHGFVGIYVYNCKAHVKNIKMYAVTLP